MSSWWSKIFTPAPTISNEQDQSVYKEPVSERDQAGNFIVTNGVHPVVFDTAQAMIRDAKALGLRVDLFEGHRSFERQDYLFKVKKTTKVKGGGSWHNYGLAVDIVFKDSKNKWTWDNKQAWSRLGAIGKKYDMIWGGDWGWDMAHFEWHPMFKSTKEALAMYKKGGQRAVWDQVNEYTKAILKGVSE